MDKAQVWGATAAASKYATAKWTTESDRRKAKRAQLKPLVIDARRAVTAARAIDPQGTQAATHRAERELARAKAAVPAPMPVFALQVAAGTTAAAYLGLPLVPNTVWLWTAVATAAAAVGTVAWLVLRTRPAPGLAPTVEEKQLLARLAPAHWAAHCESRGLAGTITGDAELTESGIVCAVRLDAKWTPGKLKDAEDHVRALLGARTDLRVEIKAGKRGGWGQITLRTRLAADGADMLWNPGRLGIGLDTVTGLPVEIPLDARLIVCGASGSGKSWSSRPHMAAAHMTGDLVFVDGKGEEATVWTGVCRVAVEPEEIREAVSEVHAEMNQRKADMAARGISVWDGPQLTLFVDEGRVILAYKDKLLTQQLIDISALGRSRGVALKWATQYPMTSGDAPGIHAQIAANTDARFALRVKNLTHAQVALDDDADYGPHLIPASKPMRGHGYLGGHGAHLIRTWTMTDDMVKALPPKVWKSGLQSDVSNVVQLHKPAPAPAAGTADADVLAVLAAGPLPQKDIAERSGRPKGTVSKAVKRLADAGHITRRPDGTIAVAVSA